MTRRRRKGEFIRPPLQCHPAQHSSVKFLFEAMHERRLSLNFVSKKAGLSPVQISKWGRLHTPSVANLEAALNVIGCRLAVEPIPTDEASCLTDYYLVEY